MFALRGSLCAFALIALFSSTASAQIDPELAQIYAERRPPPPLPESRPAFRRARALVAAGAAIFTAGMPSFVWSASLPCDGIRRPTRAAGIITGAGVTLLLAGIVRLLNLRRRLRPHRMTRGRRASLALFSLASFFTLTGPLTGLTLSDTLGCYDS